MQTIIDFLMALSENNVGLKIKTKTIFFIFKNKYIKKLLSIKNAISR